MGWIFQNYFNTQKSTNHPIPNLKKIFPKSFTSTASFITNVYERRLPLFDLYRYKEYPELNDHAVWLLMSKVMIDTYLGVGHTQSDLCGYLRAFSTDQVSIATAQRKILAAKKVGAFLEYESSGRRKRRMFMMSEDWIKAHSEFWDGVRADAKRPRAL